jgi:hypothetical protein
MHSCKQVTHVNIEIFNQEQHILGYNSGCPVHNISTATKSFLKKKQLSDLFFPVSIYNKHVHDPSFAHAISSNVSARIEPNKPDVELCKLTWSIIAGFAGKWGNRWQGEEKGGGGVRCKAPHALNRSNAAAASASPCAAARRYHRMASALSCATP